MLEHVPIQMDRVAKAGVALQTHVGLLSGVSPHVELQLEACTEEPHVLVTPPGLSPE